MKRLLPLLALVVALLGVSPAALAHQVSHAFLSISQPAGAPENRLLQLQWDIPLRDLDMVLDLDADRDGVLTHGEIRARAPALANLAGTRLTLSTGDRACAPDAPLQSLYRHADGVHARLAFAVRCPTSADPLVLHYTLFAGFDASHRVVIEQDGRTRLLETGQTVVLDGPAQADEAESLASRLDGFVRSGVHHILIGWDHLAFLLALLIASTLAPARPSARTGAHGLSRGVMSDLREVAWSVTAFTLAHSVTLSLAALGYLSLPAGPVEAAIAASVVLAAAANLLRRRYWHAPKLAFAFGLVHGLGFASVMIESGAASQSVALGLFGFNLGVELGQLAFVLAVLPLFVLLGRSDIVARRSGATMSWGLMALGAYWFAERAGDLGVV